VTLANCNPVSHRAGWKALLSHRTCAVVLLPVGDDDGGGGVDPPLVGGVDVEPDAVPLAVNTARHPFITEM
jgi:hypothetical protein